MKGLLLRGGKRWGKFRRQGSRKSLNLDCTSEMTLLPRKTSFRWKGISSLQAPKKKERRKKKKERALRIKRGRLTKIERKKGSARKAVEGGVLHRRGEVEGRGGERRRENTHCHLRAHVLPFARTKTRVDYYLTPPCGFSIYFRRRVRNVYTGFALIGQGISHRVMKGAG